MLLKNGTSRKTGVHFTDYFYSYNSIIIFVKQLLETNRDKIKRIQFEQDESRTYEIEGYCLQKQKFFPIGYVMHIEDITDDEQLERFKLWSTTAQKLIHDIKTPLSTLMLSVRTIQDKLAGDPEQAALIIQPDLTMLNEELYRIREMAKSFLQFISFDKPNLERVSLKSIIESTLTRFKNYFIGELKLNIDLDDKYDNILADANQLEIVFVVLIENAIEAMQGKGNIQISSSMAHNLSKNFTPYLDVYIADTGPGIPEEHKKSIFEPFFTTKNEGTGMGLAIVKRIITDHSGEVSLHSREHFATIFRISLQICNNFGESDDKNINN
jgi:two-component system nitrogen regulation sensor histidine kinase NtrY